MAAHHAQSTGSMSMHADGEQTITTQRLTCHSAMVEVLDYVSMVHAGLPWIGLKNNWMMVGMRTASIHGRFPLSLSEKKADIGYLFRDGTDE